MDLAISAVATDCSRVAVRLESNGLQKASRRIPTGLLRSSPLNRGLPEATHSHWHDANGLPLGSNIAPGQLSVRRVARPAGRG